MTAAEQKKKLSKLNAALTEFDTPELETFTEPMPQEEHEMAFALAEMYVNKGFRTYLTRQYERAIRAQLNATSVEGIFFAKARILTLKELLGKAKDQFTVLEGKRKFAQTLADQEARGRLEIEAIQL